MNGKLVLASLLVVLLIGAGSAHTLRSQEDRTELAKDIGDLLGVDLVTKEVYGRTQNRLQERIDNLENRHMNRIDDLHDDLENYREKYLDVLFELGRKKGNIRELRELLEGREKKLEVLQEELEEKENRIENLWRQHRRRENELENMYSGFIDVNKRLRGVVDNLRENYQELLRRYENLKRKYEELKENYDNVRSNSGSSDLKIPTMSEIKEFVKKNKVDENEYVKGEYVCWHFANDFVDAAIRAGYEAHVVVVLPSNSSGHAMAGFRTQNNGLVFVETTRSDIVMNPLENNTIDDSGIDVKTWSGVDNCWVMSGKEWRSVIADNGRIVPEWSPNGGTTDPDRYDDEN